MRNALAVALIVAGAVPTAAFASAEAPARWGPYHLELVDDAGRVLPTWSHGGRTYTLGRKGERYLVRVRNETPRRAEVVVSVDGRDVLDGRPASFGKRGYLVEPYGEVTIDGYRLGEAAVAAFRFSSVAASYAGRTGSARDVGVIGVAVFPEREPPAAPPYEVPSDAPEPSRERADATHGREASPSAQDAQRAPAARPGVLQPREERKDHRPGLGTEFGEEHESRVVSVRFERARQTPDAVLALRYDDRRGLVALGIDVDGRRRDRDEARLRETATPFRGSGWAEPPPGWRRD
jgi:hypothetical protein